MLTTTDINLLKDIFVTKDEFRRETQSLHDLIEKRTDTIVKEITMMIKEQGEILSELKSHRIVLGNHEDRLQQLEAA